MIYKAQVSHIGSNLSCIDILTVLYSKADFKKDKLVVSKGWVAASVYALNVKYGLMPQEATDTFCIGESKYIGLIEPMGVFGCETASGSMGLGFPSAVGLALAKKLKGEEGMVYCLMSDGELQCGTTWECVLIAGKHKLDNLVVIIDDNGLQAMGKTEDILPTPIHWINEGWKPIAINGHSHDEIQRALDGNAKLPLSWHKEKRPLYIPAKTIKGKGVSFMENNNLFHYKAPNKDEYEEALKELQ